jgi:hypothetical protein
MDPTLRHLYLLQASSLGTAAGRVHVRDMDEVALESVRAGDLPDPFAARRPISIIHEVGVPDGLVAPDLSEAIAQAYLDAFLDAVSEGAKA